MNKVREIQVELGKGRRAPKSYVARIIGLGGEYGLERDFLRGEYDNGILTIRHEQLTDGVYEIQAGSGDRKYIAIDGGFVYKLGTNRADAEAVFANGIADRHPVAKLPRAKQPKAVADMRITEKAANVIREANTEQAQRVTQLPDYGSAGYSAEENNQFETVALTRRLERAWAKATGLDGATLWEATEQPQPLVRQEEQQQAQKQISPVPAGNEISKTFEINESTIGYPARASQQNIPENDLANEFAGIARTFVCKGMMSSSAAESYGKEAATAAADLGVGESVTVNVKGSRFGKGINPGGRMSGDIVITRKS